MVRGCAIPVTAVPSVSQWAEMERMAFGRGRDCANRLHWTVKALSSSAFSGEPWPMNTTGMRFPAEEGWIDGHRSSLLCNVMDNITACDGGENKSHRRDAKVAEI